MAAIRIARRCKSESEFSSKRFVPCGRARNSLTTIELRATPTIRPMSMWYFVACRRAELPRQHAGGALEKGLEKGLEKEPQKEPEKACEKKPEETPETTREAIQAAQAGAVGATRREPSLERRLECHCRLECQCRLERQRNLDSRSVCLRR